MRNLKRSLLLAGAGIAVMVVVGAAVISPRDDGDYHLQIYKEGNLYKLRGKPGNNPAEPYRLNPFLRTIDWTFTNATGNDTLKVHVEQFDCRRDATSIALDCPLKFMNPGGLDCSSADVALTQTDEKTISAEQNNNSEGCPQASGPDLWDYHIKVSTETPPSIGDADPQLVIVRDGLTKFLDSVKFILRSVKRGLHM